MALKVFSLADKAVTTAGTRVQLTATDTLVSTVIFEAPAANTGKMYVGDSSVAATQGYELSPGASVSISADTVGRTFGEEFVLSDFYVDASVNGEKVKVLYIKRR